MKKVLLPTDFFHQCLQCHSICFEAVWKYFMRFLSDAFIHGTYLYL